MPGRSDRREAGPTHSYTLVLVSPEVDEQPAAFVPVTLNLYFLVLSRPLTTISPTFDDVVTDAVDPPTVAVAVSEVIATSLPIERNATRA